MTHPRALRASVLALCLGVVATGARGQSVSVQAGNLNGSAQAGAETHADASARNCRSVTVRSGGAGASASASASSSGGESVVAGAGSPGSRVTTSDCGERHAATPFRRDHHD
jgi:hypothetical protein